MSLGGQDGGTLECSSSQSFIDTLSKGLISLAASFGFDGFDFDIETRSNSLRVHLIPGGDLVDCSKVVAAVMHSLKASNPALLITMAPQMGDIYPDSADVSPGFNDQAPLVAMAIDAIDFIWVRACGVWS
jgi:chitinase